MLKELRDGQLSLLGEKQIEQLHRETLRVLEQVGILTDSEKILEIFDGAGALIDGKKKRIKIPAKLVEEALGKAPSTVILRGRDSKKDIFLEDSRVYFGIGGTPVPFYRDPQTGEVRRPTKKDVADVARVGDALPGISFVMSLASAYDVPPEVEYLHELEVKYNNTGKPIVHPFPGAKIARKALDMAAAEAAITALLSALGGNNLIQCVGTMASGSYGSLEMAVIGNEIIGMINRILRGVEVSEDTLAFEVIDKVGPGGNFLSQKHTLKFFKQEFYIPQLFNKMPWETWLKSGGKRIEDLAAEKTREILNTHRPDPLPQITQQKLAQILKEAEEELVVS